MLACKAVVSPDARSRDRREFQRARREFQTARREFQTASCEFQTARREFQTARREFLTVRRAFQEWFEPKNLSDYPYFAVENAPLKLNIGFQVRTCFQTARREFQTASWPGAPRGCLWIPRVPQGPFENKRESSMEPWGAQGLKFSRKSYKM